MLEQTNAYRIAHGLSALRLSYSLSLNAAWKSSDMSARRYSTTHDDAFRSWDQRFRDCGYTMPGATFGENLAAGIASGVTTLQQWQGSPHHNENLLDPDFTAVGIKRVQASPETHTAGIGRWISAAISTRISLPRCGKLSNHTNTIRACSLVARADKLRKRGEFHPFPACD